MGTFDEAFLDVPAECLITSMKAHQKCFSLRDGKTGKLANKFLLVSNLIAKDDGKQAVITPLKLGHVAHRVDDVQKTVKFYTEEGNFDLVGNNIPIFFIQDAMKFPDLVHSVKMEPDRAFPQAASAHDTFWDFISLSPESAHMVMWVMSDRAIPRSFRMMEGFGVHTFRLVNDAGQSHFVKFHWKPVLGMESLIWDEAVTRLDNDFDEAWARDNGGAVYELHAYTPDPADARDHDDAIWAEPDGQGGGAGTRRRQRRPRARPCRALS